MDIDESEKGDPQSPGGAVSASLTAGEPARYATVNAVGHPGTRNLLAVGLGLLWLVWGVDALLAGTNRFPEFSRADTDEYLKAVGRQLQGESSDAAEARFLEARILNAFGRRDEAMELARGALALDSQRVDIQFFLGDILIKADRLQEARDCYREAVAVDPRLWRFSENSSAGNNGRLMLRMPRGITIANCASWRPAFTSMPRR